MSILRSLIPYIFPYIGFASIAYACGLAGQQFLSLEKEMAIILGAFTGLFQFVIFTLYRQRSDRLLLEGKIIILGDELDAVSDELEAQTARTNRGSPGPKYSTENQQELTAEIKVLQTLLGQVAAAKATPSIPVGSQDKDKDDEQIILEPIKKPSGMVNVNDADMFSVIQGAFQENRVDLYLQPIVALPSRRPCHYECFSRVRDHNDKIIFPRDYMEVANRSGLSSTLDNLLLFRCMQVIKRLGPRRPDVRFFVNISSASFRDDEFFPQFVDFMANHDGLADRLVFEFAQHDVEQMSQQTEASLLMLGDKGYQFSMDRVENFSMDLMHLARHHFVYVKIDANIIRFGETDIHPEDLKESFSRHDMLLIAAKIEEEATVVDILDYEIEFGQGYLFGEPRPSREAKAHFAAPSTEQSRVAVG